MDGLDGIFRDREALKIFWRVNGVYAHENVFEFEEVYGKFAQNSMPRFLNNSDEAKYETETETGNRNEAQMNFKNQGDNEHKVVCK